MAELTIVEQTREVATVVEVAAAQGPPGPPGPPGPAGGSTWSAVAGEDLGGHRAVRAGSGGALFYPDLAEAAHAAALAGVTTGAVAAQGVATVQSSGVMEEPSWSWSPGLPIYCGPAGVLTQAAPSGAWLRVVGVALSATKILIGAQVPIVTL